jgi:predicted transposase YdaD
LNFDTQEEKDMACEALRELFKPELEEATQKGRQEGIELGGNQMIYSLVQNGRLAPEDGAEELGISLRQLKANMTNTGFVYPKKSEKSARIKNSQHCKIRSIISTGF